MKIAIWETNHPISQTVCRRIADTIGADLYDVDKHAPNMLRYDAHLAYGILRGTKRIFSQVNHWFEIDKGLFGAGHYDGLYRVSYRNTQPLYRDDLHKPHGLDLETITERKGYTLICPPTNHVCEFFGINPNEWTAWATSETDGYYLIRPKDAQDGINWGAIEKVITFNSSVGFEAMRRGIPVISDPRSTIGSYKKPFSESAREDILSFSAFHQFKLMDKEGICQIIRAYLPSS